MYSVDRNISQKHNFKHIFERKVDILMARNNKQEKEFDIYSDKKFTRQLNNIDSMNDQAKLTVYGTDANNEVDDLNAKFNDILKNQIKSVNNGESEDVTSFLSQLVSNDKKNIAINDLLGNELMNLGGDSGSDYATVQTFIYEAYKNRLLQQSDIHEVASQLIELSEAILITRDSIISADIVEGRMSRTLKFDNTDDDTTADAVATTERMEKKFDLLKKIKDFVIPKTLEYGEFYAYIIPYSVFFDKFQKSKDRKGKYYESTVMESFTDKSKVDKSMMEGIALEETDNFKLFIEEAYKNFTIQEKTKYQTQSEKIANEGTKKFPSKEEFEKDMRNILNNITVCNDDVPLAVLEEGYESINFFKESNDNVFTEKKDDGPNLFNKIAQAKVTPDGLTFEEPDKKKKEKSEFDDISGCYVKMIEPTRIMPIKIMDTVIGYYYVQDEDITPLSGAISNTLYYSKFDEHNKESTVIDAIAGRVVKSFDKKFLKDNIKFKKTIIDCINYYNLNEKRLKFQFIPAEYICEFKIDVDMDGNGQSMLKKSLFYAKLYLMLLLFKIMSIILYSNDQRVNYVKQSGIDKNVANKVQEIARIKQSRQINITDLFSYTTLINKVGNGTEQYIPTGRSGERPIETEILSGQDVQLNTELMEMLKNSYILSTGVPAAIMNYLNEADFAKTIEQQNTKYNGRVVNYQLDFNPCITKMYKMIMKSSTSIPENVIESFSFILQPPRTSAINMRSELVGQFEQLMNFYVNLFFEDPAQSMNAEALQKEIKEFKILLAKDQLPMLNIAEVEKFIEQAKINAMEAKLRPDPANGDSGDDDGLLDDELDENPI